MRCSVAINTLKDAKKQSNDPSVVKKLECIIDDLERLNESPDKEKKELPSHISNQIHTFSTPLARNGIDEVNDLYFSLLAHFRTQKCREYYDRMQDDPILQKYKKEIDGETMTSAASTLCYIVILIASIFWLVWSLVTKNEINYDQVAFGISAATASIGIVVAIVTKFINLFRRKRLKQFEAEHPEYSFKELQRASCEGRPVVRSLVYKQIGFVNIQTINVN